MTTVGEVVDICLAGPDEFGEIQTSGRIQREA
jgi:hypothetical protein